MSVLNYHACFMQLYLTKDYGDYKDYKEIIMIEYIQDSLTKDIKEQQTHKRSSIVLFPLI